MTITNERTRGNKEGTAVTGFIRRFLWICLVLGAAMATGRESCAQCNVPPGPKTNTFLVYGIVKGGAKGIGVNGVKVQVRNVRSGDVQTQVTPYYRDKPGSFVIYFVDLTCGAAAAVNDKLAFSLPKGSKFRYVWPDVVKIDQAKVANSSCRVELSVN